jgi:hypothetical protein
LQNASLGKYLESFLFVSTCRVTTSFVANYFFLLKRNHTQGCQIFLGPKYQKGEKYTKLPQNIPNGYKIFPMAVKQTKWS